MPPRLKLPQPQVLQLQPFVLWWLGRALHSVVQQRRLRQLMNAHPSLHCLHFHWCRRVYACDR